VSRMRAVVVDFNGTLSADEPILCEIFSELFDARGRPLSAQEYFDELAGLSDPAIVRRWLGRDYPDVESVIAERVDRYQAAVADGSSIGEPVREAVRYAAARVPVAIVSGAARREIEPVVEAAGLAQLVCVIVSSDDVVEGKPHPEGYLKALDLLRPHVGASGSEPQSPLDAADVLVFEDTEAGIAAAKAAGMRCIAVQGTLKSERLAAADEIVAALDVEVVRRALA
jgi:beta-phosphoglucomutase